MGKRAFIPQLAGLVFTISTVLTLVDSVSPFSLDAHERSSTDGNGRVNHPIPSLKVDVDLVLLNATVTGPHHRLITDLSVKNFHVFEDKVEQRIAFFNHEDVPTSIGIVFDESGSMAVDIALAKQAVATLLRTSSLHDEYFLITFSDRPRLDLDFTPISTDVEREIAFRIAGGSTSLYDAVYLGLERMAHAHFQKRAMVLITDGMDNNSNYTFDDISDAARRSKVQIYPICVLSPLESEQDDNAMQGLVDIARISGGKAYFPRFFDKLEGICAKIALEIKNQYQLGYYSNNSSTNKSWRKIKVKLASPPGMPRLSVRAKAGYFAR